MFQLVTMPSSVSPMIAASADAMIEASRRVVSDSPGTVPLARGAARRLATGFPGRATARALGAASFRAFFLRLIASFASPCR
jgi:hypothetical protein